MHAVVTLLFVPEFKEVVVFFFFCQHVNLQIKLNLFL